MHRIVQGILNLEQHTRTIADDPARYRPKCCPRCQGPRLWGHGCYWRKADRRDASSLGGSPLLNPVAVLRYLCRGCKRTCSRLPECIAPRRWYGWAMQQAVLVLLLAGVSLLECVLTTGRARRTVRRWHAWLDERGSVFAFRLRSRFAELGRAGEGATFWLKLLEQMALSCAMSWLDLEIEVP